MVTCGWTCRPGQALKDRGPAKHCQVPIEQMEKQRPTECSDHAGSLCECMRGLGPESRPPDSPAVGLPSKPHCLFWPVELTCRDLTLPHLEQGGKRLSRSLPCKENYKIVPVPWGEQSSLHWGFGGGPTTATQGVEVLPDTFPSLPDICHPLSP